MTNGTVVEFDEHVGLGTVETADGERHEFHCTQIAGGGRTIEVGIEVAFEVVPRYKDRLEAYAVTPV